MGQIRLELMTPALSERCSNQLSYCPRLSYLTRDIEEEKVMHEGNLCLEGLSPSGPTVLACPAKVCEYSGQAFLSQKGGDPAAPSGTAALLRLHPPHQAYLRHRPPCGQTSDFGYPQLGWCDGRCVQGPGTYSPRHADAGLLASPTSWSRVADSSPY